jgi:hypothetical protein
MSQFKSQPYSTPIEAMYSPEAPTSPAICIPRVFKNISRRRVMAIFVKLNLGDICRIDMVSRFTQDGEQFLRVFVHLKWSESPDAQNVRQALLQPNGEVKVVYDEPWFWKLRASKSSGIRTTRKRPFPYIQSMTACEPSAEVPENEGRKDVAVKAEEEELEEWPSRLPSGIVTGRDY